MLGSCCTPANLIYFGSVGYMTSQIIIVIVAYRKSALPHSTNWTARHAITLFKSSYLVYVPIHICQTYQIRNRFGALVGPFTCILTCYRNWEESSLSGKPAPITLLVSARRACMFAPHLRLIPDAAPLLSLIYVAVKFSLLHRHCTISLLKFHLEDDIFSLRILPHFSICCKSNLSFAFVRRDFGHVKVFNTSRPADINCATYLDTLLI